MDDSFKNDLSKALPSTKGSLQPPAKGASRVHVPSSHTDVYVAVMGVTGSGKSTFISHCTDEPVEIGHAMESCTQQVVPYTFKWSDDTTMHLVDTPGFDDTNRTDTMVLKEIAGWLTETYSQNIKLNGIIYLHRITDRRLQGSAKRNLFMFKKLCGDDALKNIVLATTMWEDVSKKIGVAREDELKENENFWGWMISKGSQTYRHLNNQESALEVLKRFAGKEKPISKVTLDIQSQMVEERKTLDQTSAGIQLGEGMAEDRIKLAKEMEELKRDILEAKEKRDVESAAMLRDQQDKMDASIRRLDDERERLKADTERLHEEREARLKEQLRQAMVRTEQLRAELEAVTENQRREFEQELASRESGMAALSRELEATQRRMRKEIETLEKNLNPRVGSHPDKNRIKEFCSVSIWGNKCYFCGPVCHYLKVAGMFESKSLLRHVILGENDSWYLEYQIDGKDYSQSGNLEEAYPGLWKELVETNCRRVTCLSLGPKGSYFLRMENTRKFDVPDRINKSIDDWDNVKYLWLGKSESYLAVDFDGGTKWNFQGHYPGLHNILKARTEPLLALALNPVDGTCFAAVWDNWVAYSSGENRFNRFKFEDWTTKNMGLTWDGSS